MLVSGVNLFYSMPLRPPTLVEINMKKVVLSSLTLFAVILIPTMARANDLMVASAMQRCATNEDCALVTNSCSDNCGFVPVNKQNLGTLQATYQQRCGKVMEQNPQCNMNPPIAAACINARCTIDYAYANHAGAKDYQSGAYPVPESPVPSQVPSSAAPANDRQGFTAYQMEQQGNAVKQNSLGTIYVPANSPVSGGNYVPVAPTAAVAPYNPTQGSYATPTTVKPAPAPAVAPAPVPKTAPKPAPVPVTPAAATQEATQPAPAPVAAPAPTPAPVPTATTTPHSNATPANPIPSSASDTIPEPRVPEEEPMLRGTSPDTGNTNAPIPPSEYKSQTFVPPPGSTIQVAPEDPGAKPPEGTVLLAPTPRGPDETPTFQTKTTKTDQDTNE